MMEKLHLDVPQVFPAILNCRFTLAAFFCPGAVAGVPPPHQAQVAVALLTLVQLQD